jgi:hypothetical protein
MAHIFLIVIYAAGFLADVIGIVLIVKDVYRIVDNGDGTGSLSQGEGWKPIRGPIVIGIGAAIGACGNIASIYI